MRYTLLRTLPVACIVAVLLGLGVGTSTSAVENAPPPGASEPAASRQVARTAEPAQAVAGVPVWVAAVGAGSVVTGLLVVRRGRRELPATALGRASH